MSVDLKLWRLGQWRDSIVDHINNLKYIRHTRIKQHFVPFHIQTKLNSIAEKKIGFLSAK